MVPEVLPLRAVVLQCLLLSVTVAIESYVLYRLMRTTDNQRLTPRQSIQYATSINLLSTVLGWFVIFSFFRLETSLPSDWTRGLETVLLNFMFFNQLSNETLSILIVLAFVTFFASFIVKQVGLWGLRWLLQSEFPQISKEPESDREKASISGVRDLRKEPRDDDNPLNISAVLFANAWSYSAILVILLLLNF